MSRSTELQQWLEELDGEIHSKQEAIKPALEELDRLRQQRLHVRALLDGQSVPFEDVEPAPAFAKKGIWVQLCREHGWRVGGDSAHRVVMRESPSLHGSVPHICPYV